MNEQVFWTILLGVTVYVLGHVFVKFVIDPIQNLYKLIGEVGHSLIYYANLYSNTQVCDKSQLQEAHDTLRRQSCQLFSSAYAVPGYGLWARLRLLPPYYDVQEAVGELIGLSNGCLDTSNLAAERNSKRRRMLEQLLRL